MTAKMSSLNTTVVQAQERFRKLRYPFRITNNVITMDNNFAQRRLLNRYTTLQEWYSREVATYRRVGVKDSLLGEMQREGMSTFDINIAKRFSEHKADEENINWDWDFTLLLLKFMSNADYATDNKNAFLMREGIADFPIMNYALKEGPYKAPKEAKFGPEDKHVVLRTDGGNLVFYIPEITGLDTGYYVECLA